MRSLFHEIPCFYILCAIIQQPLVSNKLLYTTDSGAVAVRTQTYLTCVRRILWFVFCVYPLTSNFLFQGLRGVQLPWFMAKGCRAKTNHITVPIQC